MNNPAPDDVEYIPPYAASTYAKLAATYGKTYYEQIATAATDHLRSLSGRMLDAGTGPGLLPINIALRNPKIQIHAVDYTHQLLAFGRERARDQDVGTRIEFLQSNIYTLPFADETYAFVTCTGVLHGLEEPMVALTELYRVLEPGGTAWVFDPTILNLDENYSDHLTRHEQEVVTAYRSTETGMSTYTNKEAEQIVNATPFEIQSIERGADDDLRIHLLKPP